MKADRLIAVLLLLQRRGRVTAAEVAAELEVSMRTARRDLEALGMSGVPVYSQPGRGGGWQLIGDATTDLTGLSADETHAVFLAAGAAPISGPAQLPALKSALRKLTVALPETFRDEAEAAGRAIKVDGAGWGEADPDLESPFLDLLTQAVVTGHQVEISYAGRQPGKPATPGTRVVHPLGMVAKRSVWYMVANTDHGMRTFRLSRISAATVLIDRVDRPADFDLDRHWAQVVDTVEAQRIDVTVAADVEPSIVRILRTVFGSRLQATARKPSPQGWVRVLISDYSVISFCAQIAGFGSSIRLVDPPPEVRSELRRIATELQDTYLGF